LNGRIKLNDSVDAPALVASAAIPWEIEVGTDDKTHANRNKIIPGRMLMAQPLISTLPL
jgi:hypothetical protein